MWSVTLNNKFIVAHLASFSLHFVATALSATTSPLKFASFGTYIRPVEKNTHGLNNTSYLNYVKELKQGTILYTNIKL